MEDPSHHSPDKGKDVAKISKKGTLNPSDKNYQKFLSSVITQIGTTKLRIARSATREQMVLYWWLGNSIEEMQTKYGWGKSVVERLSTDLKKSFPDAIYGFSPRNLWNMRHFYLEYKDNSNLQRLVAEIPWGQNLVIMSKVKDLKAREFYIQATIQMGWTRDVLNMQINSETYERQILSDKQHNFDKALPAHLAEQAHHAMKDVYMLDMLGIAKPVLEAEIERRMVEKIKDVLLELGYGFTFMGNQYRIHANEKDYLIDLLFYNRRLKSLVAVELKKGKFEPEFAGKMNFYLSLLDDFVKEPDENPSIGIILCAEKDRFEVEYALRGINKPVGVSEFKLTRTLPKDLIDKLPDVKYLEDELLREMAVITEEENEE